MSRRAKDEDQDSLELLLDTICNVFGGIILMALLVVLQTQASVERIRPRATPTDGRAAERYERDIRRDEEELLSLEAEERTLAPHREAAVRTGQVLGRRGEFLSAIEAAQRRLDKAGLDVKALSDKTVELDRDRASLEERVRRAGAEVEAAQARAGAVAEAVDRRVRLPLRHSQAAPIQRSVLVSGGRVHRLPEECTSEPVPPSGARYRPVPGTGTQVIEGQPASAFLGECSPALHYVSFWVEDGAGSFETFQRARGAVLAAGFEYTVSPFPSAEGIVLHPGRPNAE